MARLWAEAQELVSDLEVVQGEYYRARDAYEQACMQASRLLDDRNKARESAAAAAAAAEAAAAEESEMAARGAQSVAAPTSPTKTREVCSISGERLQMSSCRVSDVRFAIEPRTFDITGRATLRARERSSTASCPCELYCWRFRPLLPCFFA